MSLRRRKLLNWAFNFIFLALFVWWAYRALYQSLARGDVMEAFLQTSLGILGGGIFLLAKRKADNTRFGRS